MNPLRAGIAEDPSLYIGSSCRVRTGKEKQSWLDLDPFYLSLGSNEGERAVKYRQWLEETTSESERKLIREAVQRGQLTGSKLFAHQISEKLGRRIELRGSGRPHKGRHKHASEMSTAIMQPIDCGTN